MWTVIFITCSKKNVDKIRTLFRENSVLMRIRKVKNDSNSEECCYEILVPYTESAIAQDIIIEEEINQ